MIAQTTPSSTLSFHSFINSASQAPAPVANPAQFATINQVEAAALMSCTGTQIKVYLAIAGHANPQGTCWPSRERIASIVGIQPVHVSRATAALERKGLLIKETLPNGKVVYGLPLHPIPRQTQPVPRAAPPRYHERHPEQIIEQTKEQREQQTPISVAEPATVEPAPAPLSVPKVIKIESRTVLPEDWTLPEDWQSAAQTLRPDLDVATIQTSAANFRDYHLSRGTQVADWKYEWTRWIRRERRPKPTSRPATPTHPSWGSPTPTSPPTLTPEERAAREQAARQRLEEADRHAEERRIQRLIAHGIDPATGQHIAHPETTPLLPKALQGEHRTPPLPLPKKPWIAPPMTRAQQIAVLELRQAGVGRDEAVAAVLNDPGFIEGKVRSRRKPGSCFTTQAKRFCFAGVFVNNREGKRMKGLRFIGLIMPIVFALGCTQSYSEIPPLGSLQPGEVVFVDDGTCPPGKIKRIIGADWQRGEPRRVRCVKRPR